MPAIIEASAGIFGAVAAPLGNIDKMVVIDQGNGGADGGSAALGQIAKTSPAVVFGLLQQLEALGLNVPAVMQQLGLSPTVRSANGDAKVDGETPPTSLIGALPAVAMPSRNERGSMQAAVRHRMQTELSHKALTT